MTMFFSVASRGVPCVAYTSRTAPLPPHALSQNKRHIKTLLGRCEDRKGRINIGAYIATTKSNEIVSAVQIHHANERRSQSTPVRVTLQLQLLQLATQHLRPFLIQRFQPFLLLMRCVQTSLQLSSLRCADQDRVGARSNKM